MIVAILLSQLKKNVGVAFILSSYQLTFKTISFEPSIITFIISSLLLLFFNKYSLFDRFPVFCNATVFSFATVFCCYFFFATIFYPWSNQV